MTRANIDFPEQMRRFSHGLDPLNPFQIWHAVRRGEEQGFVGDIHLDPQLFIVISGEVDFHLDNEMHKGTDADIFISNFWEPHAFKKTSAELEYLVVTFSLFSIGEMSPFADFDWLLFMKQPPAERKVAFPAEEKEKILALAGKIIRLNDEQPAGWRSLSWFAIHELLYFIDLQFMSHKTAPKKMGTEIRLFPALELIRHYPQREIPLDEAAAACCMSRSAFCLAFKSTMNESFSHFAMKKRIAYACMLLKSNKHSIKEVSEMCGFADVTHFYHTFKKIRKCTPADFKQSL